MGKFKLFVHIIIADMKRLTKYIPSLIIYVLLLLLVCSGAAWFISKHIYKEGENDISRLVYYVPKDDDEKYTSFATRMLAEMESMKENADMVRIGSIDEGYKMLENGEASCFIIVPENFFSSILDGINPTMEIIVNDNTTISSYITNELFLSYAWYLGTSQAASYSMFDTLKTYGYSKEERNKISDRVDIIYLDRTLNKTGYTDTVNATNEGSFTLFDFYLASAVTICLFLSAIVIMPMLNGRGNGIMLALNVRGISTIHLFLCNTLLSFFAVYLAFVPCFITLSIFVKKHINIVGLISVIPALLVIAAIISLAAMLGKRSLFAANMLILFMTVILSYVGGGLIPHNMLPAAIQDLSNILPGRYIIISVAKAIISV